MKLKYIIIIVTSILIAACEFVGDIDDIKPQNLLTDDNQITDARSAELSLNGVYSSWRTMNIGWFVNCIAALTQTQAPSYLYGVEGFVTNEVKKDNTRVKAYYIGLYKVINNANTLIQNLSKANPKDLTPQRKKEILAEARFHRALAHFQLLRSFGEFYDINSTYGVVIHSKPVRKSQAKARETVAKTYEFIIKDLTEVIADASEQMRGHYYIGKVTAKALLAKVYLAKGDFEKSAKWAKEVLASSTGVGYLLEENFLDIFEKRQNSSEVLFAPNVLQDINDSPMEMDISLSGNETLVKIADELVEGEGNQQTGEGYDPRFAKVYPKVDEFGDGMLTQKNNKYPQLSYVKGEPGNTLFVLRLAEIYLIAAEAEYRRAGGDKQAAREYFQSIATRAGYAPNYVTNVTDKDFLVTLLKHKYIELSNETGEEWYDLVRYKKLDNLKIAPDYVKSDAHLLFPIPQAAISGNKLLVQNPTY